MKLTTRLIQQKTSGSQDFTTPHTMTSRTTALLCLAVALPLVESLGLLRKGPLQQRDAANQELASLFQEDTKA